MSRVAGTSIHPHGASAFIYGVHLAPPLPLKILEKIDFPLAALQLPPPYLRGCALLVVTMWYPTCALLAPFRCSALLQQFHCSALLAPFRCQRPSSALPLAPCRRSALPPAAASALPPAPCRGVVSPLVTTTIAITEKW